MRNVRLLLSKMLLRTVNFNAWCLGYIFNTCNRQTATYSALWYLHEGREGSAGSFWVGRQRSHTSPRTHAGWPGPYTGNTEREETGQQMKKQQHHISYFGGASVLQPQELPPPTARFDPCAGFSRFIHLPECMSQAGEMNSLWNMRM